MLKCHDLWWISLPDRSRVRGHKCLDLLVWWKTEFVVDHYKIPKAKTIHSVVAACPRQLAKVFCWFCCPQNEWFIIAFIHFAHLFHYYYYYYQLNVRSAKNSLGKFLSAERKIFELRVFRMWPQRKHMKRMHAVCLAHSGGITTGFPTNGKLGWPLFAITHGAKKRRHCAVRNKRRKNPRCKVFRISSPANDDVCEALEKWIRHRMNFHMCVSRSPQTLSQRSHSQFLFHLQKYFYIVYMRDWL